MTEHKTETITASAMLQLLTDALGDDGGSQSRIRLYYGKFRTRVGDSEARMLAAVKYLKDLITDNSSKGS